MSNYPTCTYIKTNGTICQSPALTASEFCYYHGRDQKRLENLSRAQGYKCMDGVNGFLKLQESINPEVWESLQIPSLDDAESIQVALTTLIRAICYNHITERKAGLALYGLQLAAMNVSRVKLATTTDHYTKVDPNPIGEFWSGDGYRKYIAKRGLALLKAQELDTQPDDRAQEEHDALRQKWDLEDAAGVKRSPRF